jgi:hypothetical protein
MVGLHRTDVDDAAAGALAIHLARRGWSRMRGPNGSLLPLDELALVERYHRLDAGVADQNYRCSQKQRWLLPYCVHLRVVGKFHGDADSTVHIAEFGRSSNGTRLSEIGDENFGDFAEAGGGLADVWGRTVS